MRMVVLLILPCQKHLKAAPSCLTIRHRGKSFGLVKLRQCPGVNDQLVCGLYSHPPQRATPPALDPPSQVVSQFVLGIHRTSLGRSGRGPAITNIDLLACSDVAVGEDFLG